MTREEAIKWLDRLYIGADITDEYGDMENVQPYEEALNMAIKALSQEPCEDAISRQGLLNRLDDFNKWCKDGRLQGSLFAVDVIKDMPPVTPKARWIPVSERLPIIGEDVLICDYDGDLYISYLHTDGKWGYDYSGNKLKNIMAWMPLPQPYVPEINVGKMEESEE